jgi:steroid delta-isomerase-like uncharacterized protein
MGLDRPPTKPPPQELERIAEEWMERIWRRHDLEAIDQLHAPDFIDRSSAGRNTDNEAYKAGIADLYVAFPDFFAQTHDLMPNPTSGKIAIRWSATGTHSATFFGIPASGKQIKFTGIEILHIQNNRIIERWGEWDGLAILNQLK